MPVLARRPGRSPRLAAPWHTLHLNHLRTPVATTELLKRTGLKESAHPLPPEWHSLIPLRGSEVTSLAESPEQGERICGSVS